MALKRHDYNDMTLEELLTNCTNPKSVKWQQSWDVFLNKYKKFIYKQVYRRCYNWNIQRIKHQLTEEVDDIVFQVINTLIKDDYKFLKQYNNRDNTKLFLTYVATLTDRVTKKHIVQHFNNNIGLLENEYESNIFNNLEPEAAWELYEQLVAMLRAESLNKHPNNERNIHLFLMYTWTDMSIDMLTQQQFYKKLGAGAIYTLINRMRKKIRKV